MGKTTNVGKKSRNARVWRINQEDMKVDNEGTRVEPKRRRLVHERLKDGA